MEYCVKTKDHLLDLIRQGETDGEIIANCETVLTVLEHTTGLWRDTHYCYKASEIAQRIIDRLKTLDQTHHARQRRLEPMYAWAHRLIARYNNLQLERFRVPNAYELAS